MQVFYGSSSGKADVPGSASVTLTLDAALDVFRSLDQRSGFMGIQLDQRFVVQFAPQNDGGIRVELLDTGGPSFDACVADAEFAEHLIWAAATGQDVFQIARNSKLAWEHTDLT